MDAVRAAVASREEPDWEGGGDQRKMVLGHNLRNQDAILQVKEEKSFCSKALRSESTLSILASVGKLFSTTCSSTSTTLPHRSRADAAQAPA